MVLVNQNLKSLKSLKNWCNLEKALEDEENESNFSL
jgi:hypothetical protein